MPKDWNPDPEVVAEIRRNLKSYADRRPEIVIGSEPYTAAQLLTELEQGTDVGKELYEMHLKLRQYGLYLIKV